MERLEDKVCPRCGNKGLVKKDLGNGKYSIVCPHCGLERGEFSPDSKKGVV